MLMSGFQPKLSRKSRIFKSSLMVRWLRLAFLRSFMSLTLFGGTLWERRMLPSRESSHSKFKTYVASSWPRKHSMKMFHREKFPDSRKNLLLLTCSYTTIRGKNSRRRLLDPQVEAMASLRSLKLCKTKRRHWKAKMKTFDKGLGSWRLTRISPTRIAARKEQPWWTTTWTKWGTKVIFHLKLCE